MRAPGARHCVLQGEEYADSDFLNFVFRLFAVRRYDGPMWRRLVPGIPPVGEPAWDTLQTQFREAYAIHAQIFQSNFRPGTMRGYVAPGGRFHGTYGLTRDEREVLTLQLLYGALPRGAIQDFAAEACPRTFADMIDKMRVNFAPIRGVFGDYSIKVMLDMLVMLGSVPRDSISRWPTACPGYRRSLASLFPGLPEELHLLALYWVHRQLGRTWRFEFPESCAQLCWDHRRVTGSLSDLMDCDDG